MNFRRTLLILTVFLVVLFSMTNPCLSEVKKVQEFPRTGVIESISPDLKYFVINKEKYLVSQKTRIVDEKGNVLKLSDIKPKLLVTVESVPTPRSGRLTKKVVVMERRIP